LNPVPFEPLKETPPFSMLGLFYHCRTRIHLLSILPSSPEEHRENQFSINGKKVILSQKIEKSGVGGVAFLDVQILWKTMF
jgi:hypothetical protein